MNILKSLSFAQRVCAVSLLSALSVSVLTGCGLGNVTDPALNQSHAAAFPVSGLVYGGNQPIANATVKIYETATTGVATSGVYVPASPLTALGTTTTSAAANSLGSFAFSPSVTCASSADYTYITVSGGSAGGTGTNNPNTLLMAYSGPCSAIQAYTWVNEVTTVAMAYALGSFTSISGSTVSITSDATNYATVSTTPGSIKAAGLAHAFLNAQNLANMTTGAANTTITTLGTNQATIVPTAVPTAEINSLADALQGCVNSNGGSATTASSSISFTTPTTPTASAGATSTLTPTGSDTLAGNFSLSLAGAAATTFSVPFDSTLSSLSTLINNNTTLSGEGVSSAVASGVLTVTGPVGTTNTLSFTGTYIAQDVDDGSNCGRLFGYTPSVSGSIPTNTLQAVLNLAKFPYSNAGAVNSIFNLVAANSGAPFTPTLTAAPKDWTISIYYFIGAGGTGQPAASYPYYGTLDASDNFYLLNSSASTPAAGTNTAVYSFSSNGTLNYANLTTGLGTTYPAAYTLTPDQYGNLWANQNSTAIIQLKASDGTFVASYTGTVNSVKGIAADPLGNIWLGRSQITTDVLGELIYAGTGATNGSGASVYPLESTVYAELGAGTGSATITGLNYGKGPAWGPYGLTFDAGSNLWYAGYYSAGTGIVVLPNSNGTTAYTFSTPTAPTASAGAVSTLTYSNLVAVNGSLSISIAGGTPITGTISGTTGPSAFATAFNAQTQFSTAGLTANTTGGTLSIVGPVGTANTLSFTGTSVSAAAPSYAFTPAATNSAYISASLSAGTTPYAVGIDSSGNAWSIGAVTPTLNKFVVTRTGSVPTGTVTAVAAGVAVSNNSSAGFSAPHFLEIDGGGNLWIADDASGHGVEVYPTTSGTTGNFLSESAGYQACVIVSGACVANTSSTGAAPARSVSVDSAGSVWIVGGTTVSPQQGTVMQMFGGASPTWWQGAAKPGVMP